MKISVAASIATLLSSLSFAADQTISVSILKTPEPIKFRMESSMLGGFLWMASSVRNSSMSDRLSDVLVRADLRLNEALGRQVSAELTKRGVVVSQGISAAINPVKPWDVRYSAIQIGSDALLHIYIEKVGIQSRPESSTYRPFAHVVYCLYAPSKSNDCTYSDRAYYGEGYKEEDYLVYPANDAYQWTDSDDVMRRVDNVAESLRSIVDKVSPGIAAAIVGNIEEMQKSAPK